MLRGQAAIFLREDVVSKKSRRQAYSASAQPGDADAEILAALKALRGDLARRRESAGLMSFFPTGR